MKRTLQTIALAMMALVSTAQINTDKYLWFYPSQNNLVINQGLQNKLQEEMQKITDRGNLLFRPQTCRYFDQYNEDYFIYQEPGRILRTVAMAFPYLTQVQKNTLKTMVSGLFPSGIHAPWSPAPIGADQGNPREYYQADVLWGLNSPFGSYRPTIQGVYNVWLYLYRTGDTMAVQPYYEDIRTFYNDKTGNSVDPGNLYGTLCAHIGMARLAHIFNDTAQISYAKANLNQYMEAGLDIHYVDSMAFYGTQGWNAPYGPEYQQRKDHLIYRGFIFLGLSPEAGRYLRDTVFSPVMQRHLSGLADFPYWWLQTSPYFTRWAGDESIGIPSEMFGMIMPVERWVRHQEPQIMFGMMHSSPSGIADCYWLEALIDALESASVTEWMDVRTTPFVLNAINALPEISVRPQPPLPGSDSCYGAMDFLSTGGNGQSFIISTGSHASLKAGKCIALKEGTKVNAGGSLHASIAPFADICPQPTPDLSDPSQLAQVDCQAVHPDSQWPALRIIPNPASEFVLLEIVRKPDSSLSDIEIFDMRGSMVSGFRKVSGSRIGLKLTDFPAGVYLVRLKNSFPCETSNCQDLTDSKRMIVIR